MSYDRGMRLGWALPVLVAALFGSAAAAEPPARLGEALFLDRCAGCHGVTGDGKGPLARALSPRPHLTWKGKAWDTDGNGVGNEDADLRDMIRNGAGHTAAAR